MRNFNEYEKDIINRISKINPIDMITISKFIQEELFSINSGLALAFLPSQKVAILYLKGKKEDDINRQRMIEFFELISLIDYLRTERYIHIYNFYNYG